MELNEVIQVIEDGRLDDQSKSWLEEAASLLANNGEETRARVVASVLDTKQFVTPAEFLDNAVAIVENDNDVLLDAGTEDALGKIEYIDENGETKEFSEEIVSLAKLELAVEAAEENTPLLQVYYQARLSEKVYDILTQMPVNQAAQSDGDQNITNAQLGADGVANLFNPEFRGRVQIKADEGLGALFADRMGNIVDKGQTLAQKYGQALVDAYGERGKTFFAYLTNKCNKLDSQLTEKLGDKYTKPKAVVTKMINDGTWKEAALGIGLGATAFIGAGTIVGVAASAGLTLMTANMTRKRIKELRKKFKKEKAEAEEQEQDLSFWQFAGRNKKEIARIVLYFCATIAGGAAAWNQMGALYSADSMFSAAAASAAQKASMSKMVLMTSGTATPFASDAAANYSRYLKSGDEADKKAAKKALKKTLSIVGMAGLTYLAVSALGVGNAHGAETGNDGIAPENGTPAPETDAPAPEANGSEADGSDAGDQNQDTGDQNQGTDDQNAADPATNADETHYSIDKPSDSVQHFYENKLNDESFIPKADVDKIMANMDNIERPENMSEEMSINLARNERVWYHAGDLIDIQDVDGNPVVNVKGHIGSLVTNDDGTFLKIGDTMGQQMVDSHGRTYFDFGDKHHIYGTPKPAYLIDVMGCDEVNVNTEGYLKTLSDAFVTEQGYHTPNGELRLLNAPTDPDYVMKGNFRHTVHVNGCDESTLTRQGGQVHHEAKIDLTEQKPHVTSPVDTPSTPAQHDTPMHVDAANELIPSHPEQIADPAPVQEPAPEAPKAPKGNHFDHEGEYYNANRGAGNSAATHSTSGRTYIVRGSMTR